MKTPVLASPIDAPGLKTDGWLDRELQRVRLLLHRRVLWLRRRWGHDPLQAYAGLVVSDVHADAVMAYDDPDAERRFYLEDEAAASLTAAIEHRRAQADRDREGDEQQRRSPIEALSHQLGLSEFERDVLVLCLAPELDAELSRLYAYVQDDATLGYATPHLAVALLAHHGVAARGWHRFLPGAPLRRLRLVTLEGERLPLAFRALHLDERVLELLLGVNRLDRRVAPAVHLLRDAEIAEPHRKVVERLAVRLSAQGTAPLRAALIGARGIGSSTAAAALCRRLGLQPYRIDVSMVPDPGDRLDELLALLEREAALLQLAFVVDLREAEGRLRNDVLARVGAPVIALCEAMLPDPSLLSVVLPPLDVASKVTLWQRSLENVEHRVAPRDLERLCSQFDPSPGSLSLSVDRAASRAAERGDRIVSSKDVWDSCRAMTAPTIHQLAVRLEPSHDWEDLVLPDDELAQLREIGDQVANRASVYEAWGFGRRLGRGRGVTALFSGPSGTGKTMAAEVLAGHLGLDLYRIDLAGVVSKYIGETEKNLRRLFDETERSGVILFFDEADALFGKRSEIRDSHDRYANIEIDYLLQRMEHYRGVAILATNERSLLDPAFLRRLRFVVEFPFPDAELRRRIWEKCFPPETPVHDLDFESLSTLEVAGGNIKNIALAAAFLAAARGEDVRMAHVLHAARREYAKIDRLPPDATYQRASL